ncbi:MAG: Xanthine and CO dehydrogenases maturation factor, XdhC/CoxF family [uncultured Paraburkholderia sp.]|nr:MAG: Xanthine and CO dehydrogenases maturation factor, XdhC/CoxF family [uncultured Paraburkholderia sp.]CAH2805159.1 MAG: Xanthine and CO dehydrogenases maturation factor, XdhC/CoxF family [uncultured Paraburkholderia sp.]CAH2940191.1 MAG: Xanthine and CO dehydrogenases maturation factor, XdhC/CoxF family [uncultured Paraburkholderia sp.]
MQSEDLEVLVQCARWIDEGWRALLVTVVKTWGSSPRPEGAMLCIREDGRVVGSVSGGCIEDDLIHRVCESGVWIELPETVEYGISADEAHRFGLPCGGTIRLVLEPVSRRGRIHELLDAVMQHKLVARTLDMRTGHAEVSAALTIDGVLFNGDTLTTVHGPRYRMLVVGVGQLSRYFCEIAQGLDYQVTVCDPREDYASPWCVRGKTLTRNMPDDVVTAMQLDSRAAVVALTHDPKLDDLALMEALRTPAFYVGALGSRRNNATRRKRLLEFDLTAKEIARLRGPAGLYIGSKTPAEIAISILAEITAAKNGVDLNTLPGIDDAKNRMNAIDGAHFVSSCMQ